MNDILARNSYDPPDVELRRLKVAGLALLAASGIWYSVRPVLSEWVARSSIGCGVREGAVSRVLQAKYPDVPVQVQAKEMRFPLGPSAATNVQSFAYPEPGWLLCQSTDAASARTGGPPFPRAYLFDHKLSFRGLISLETYDDMDRLTAPPLDADGDGRWELVIPISIMSQRNPPRAAYIGWIVVRVSKKGNEIVWAGLTQWHKWLGATRLCPVWQDGSRLGGKRLAIVTQHVKVPGGSFVGPPSRTIAVFDWDRPGGILQTVQLAADDGIYPWAPDQNAPVPVSPDECLDVKIDELMPVPAEVAP